MRHVLLLLCLAAAVTGCDDDPCGGSPPAFGLPADHLLLQPDSPAMKLVPPDTFEVRFETSEGDVLVRVYRHWSPLGAYRFYNLARNGFYDGSRFFRVLPGFVAQFGLSGHPALDQTWAALPLPDDPPATSNRAGTLVYAVAGPNTRTTQLFFNYTDNTALDGEGFTPFGRVVSGMDVLLRLHSDYGEVQPDGSGPVYTCMLSHGNRYLDRRYPELDYIRRAVVLE